ncbi:hypothetical protein L6164_025431 [Bauhinia variegata]|uniref:Uncharacterized protein n=1 Tax=Bauhinia variegata TaxID=167791 RepID=A0ACB9M0W4_BAUVA|nr:hypothetical protein L6164_025431 [Bauhinia variegata]
MAGLSVVLEAQKSSFSRKAPQVINKTTMNMMLQKPCPPALSPSSTPFSFSVNSHNSFSLAPTFLDQCFLCSERLLPGNDIYMYKGERAFCSVECRCKQIFMDEEESFRNENCSMAAIRPTTATSSSSSSSGRHRRKGSRNRAGGFAY